MVARANQKGQKPFALIGVNTNQAEAKNLKEVMGREKLNWPSFVSRESPAVEWNNPGNPMYYVIDHRGVIRYKLPMRQRVPEDRIPGRLSWARPESTAF